MTLVDGAPTEIMTSPPIAYLLAAMLSWRPSHEASPFHAARETQAETRARYLEIAIASYRAAMEHPIRLGTKDDALATALEMLGVAFEENGFRKDVQDGRVVAGGSWCLWSLNIGKGRTQEGWSGPELVADIDKCAAAGLRAMRQSWGCGALEDRLTPFASGQCVTARNEGEVVGGPMIRALSRARVMRGIGYWWSHPYGRWVASHCEAQDGGEVNCT